METDGLYMILFYIALSLKILYIVLSSIGNFIKDSLDTRAIMLSKFTKNYLKQIKDIVAFSFIIYIFNPFNKTTVRVLYNEKVALFIFALIGLANVKWNFLLNLLGIHLPFFET